jgi:hypothetical protein
MQGTELESFLRKQGTVIGVHKVTFAAKSATTATSATAPRTAGRPKNLKKPAVASEAVAQIHKPADDRVIPTLRVGDRIKPIPAWKVKHEQFIRNIRMAKGLPPTAPSTGHGANSKQEMDKALVALEDSSKVQCTRCLRKFSSDVAERHLPKCEEIFKRNQFLHKKMDPKKAEKEEALKRRMGFRPRLPGAHSS